MTAAPKLVEPQPTQSRNLIQKCAAVMASVAHVPKRGRNSFHNYDYATEADIADAVRESMAHEGVMLIPSVEKAEWREAETKSGKERAVTLTVRYRLTDGAESLEFVILGEGQDRGDKATYKAMTGATKYALLKLFLISTGDDPEAEEGEKPPPARGTAPTVKPAEEKRPEAPPHVRAAWEAAKRLHPDTKGAAESAFNAAIQKVIGSRPSYTMTADEAQRVEAEMRKAATKAAQPSAPDDDIRF